MSWNKSILLGVPSASASPPIADCFDNSTLDYGKKAAIAAIGESFGR
jgi:hypothetical protein